MRRSRSYAFELTALPSNVAFPFGNKVFRAFLRLTEVKINVIVSCVSKSLFQPRSRSLFEKRSPEIAGRRNGTSMPFIELRLRAQYAPRYLTHGCIMPNGTLKIEHGQWRLLSKRNGRSERVNTAPGADTFFLCFFSPRCTCPTRVIIATLRAISSNKDYL